jgi:lysophospholipase L1-like esterase
MNWRQICLGAVLCASLMPPVARAGVLDGDGIGAYGDSMTMQYSQWVPAAAIYGLNVVSNGTQFNWVDHLVMSGYNFGPTGQVLGYPYNVYNAGVAGFNSPTLGFQVTRIQPYLATAEIKTVVINMGANDFGNDGYYDHFYAQTANPSYNPLNDPEAAEVIGIILTNIEGAMQATLSHNPNARFVLHTVPDLGVTPDYIADQPNASRRARVATVFDALNQQIVELAAQYGSPVVDLNAMAGMLSGGGSVAGIPMLYSGGTTGNHAFLSDGFHPGTVMQGFIANAILEAHHIAWGDPIDLISDQTIATRAGLTPQGTGPTYQDMSQFVIFVPEPSSVVLAAVGVAALLATTGYRRRVGQAPCA